MANVQQKNSHQIFVDILLSKIEPLLSGLVQIDPSKLVLPSCYFEASILPAGHKTLRRKRCNFFSQNILIEEKILLF